MKKIFSIFMYIVFALYGSLEMRTASLDFVTSARFSHGALLSLDWHTIESSKAQFIAYVGNNQGHHDIRIAQLRHNGTELQLISKSHIAGSNGRGWANATAWTDSGPRHLAVGGFNNNKGHELRLYNYNDHHLDQRTAEDMPEVLALDWLRINGKSYLAVAGSDKNNGREVRVYEYNNDVLILRSTATFFHGKANSVKWFVNNNNNVYLAVGGFAIGSTDTNVRVYLFDISTQLISLVDTSEFDFYPVYSVSWVTDGTNIYLAAGGYAGNNTNQIRIYNFNGASLTEVTMQPFGTGIVYATDWIFYNNTMFFAVAGDDEAHTNEVRVFRFDGTLITLVSSLNLGSAIPYTIAWQFVNNVPYLAVGSDDDSAALALYAFFPQT